VRDRLAELAAQGGAPQLQEPLRIEDVGGGAELVDYLAGQGISQSDVPSALRQALSGLYGDLRVAEGDGDAQLKQAAQGRLLDELQAVVAIIEGDPPGGPLGAMVEELTLRAAAVAATDSRVIPDSSAGQLVLRLLLRAVGSAAREGGGG
jgi:hypothetical protein